MTETGAVAEALARLGGIATRAALVRATSRVEVDRALSSGAIVVLARGRYASADAAAELAAAHRLAAVLSHRSAALHWGWAVKTQPDRPDVTVSKGRHLSLAQAALVTVHRAALAGDDVVDRVTSRERTLVDCLRVLPADEALAIADSALRDGFPRARLLALTRDARGPGARRSRRLAALADRRAANPFESVLRWLAHDIEGLHVVPQVSIHDRGFLGRPDLVDEALMIALEADSFEWHGDRVALARDARRYTRLTVRGWMVLRFTYEDVMGRPEEVREALRLAVAERRTTLCSSCRAA